MLLRRRSTGFAGQNRYALYFASLGLGYLAVELALMEKFGLVLGHPNYALSVVLAALLVGSGLGALASDRLVRAVGGIRMAAYLTAGVILLVYAAIRFTLPELFGIPWLARAAVVAGLVFPLGLCLGLFLPAGLDRIKRTHPHWIPWAWAINGMCSVLAPVWGVALSMTWGINALLLAGVPIYMLAGAAFPTHEREMSAG
jgi:hypothetical protein